jgi:hypothetical protein
MTIDMSNNRVPYGLLTDEEKAALHEHGKAGGEFEFTYSEIWMRVSEPTWGSHASYRTVPLPAKTQDVIAWERLPDWAQWVARDEDGKVFCSADEQKCDASKWLYSRHILCRRIDDFPGIVVQIGTADWSESKQRRPRG